MKEMELESKVVAPASHGFKADGKYEAQATFGGKTYRATSRSSSAALNSVARKLRNAFPEVTHIEANGFLMRLG